MTCEYCNKPATKILSMPHPDTKRWVPKIHICGSKYCGRKGKS